MKRQAREVAVVYRARLDLGCLHPPEEMRIG